MKTLSPKLFFSMKQNKQLQLKAIIWATIEMRKDLVRYSDKICIDMHKASMNDIGWCYFALVVKDNGNKVHVIAECLCCLESNKMYAWCLLQLPQFEKQYQLSSTRYMFTDKLVTD